MRRYPSAKDLARITKPGRYAVGHGAYLQIALGGTRSWLLRYRVGEKQFCMGLGSAEYVTLKEALHKAWEQQRLRLSGVDPLTERQRLRAARRPKTAVPTFKDAANRYIVSQEPKWRGGASPREWRGSLENHVFPTLGPVRVDQVETQHVVSALEPIWQKAPTTARRIRTRLEAILNYAKAHGWRDGDNPATLDIVKHLLPAQNGDKKNHAAIPYRELPEIAARLQDDKTIVAKCLLFVLLTACRPSEAGGARWSEIESDTWVIPSQRTKRGREHRIPLSTAALRLLASLPRLSEFIFPAERKDHIDAQLLRLALMRLGRLETVHGLRSGFKDWATECTTYPDIVSELALAHLVGDATVRAYRRGDLLDQRRRLMQDWADFCNRLHAEGAHE